MSRTSERHTTHSALLSLTSSSATWPGDRNLASVTKTLTSHTFFRRQPACRAETMHLVNYVELGSLPSALAHTQFHFFWQLFVSSSSSEAEIDPGLAKSIGPGLYKTWLPFPEDYLNQGLWNRECPMDAKLYSKRSELHGRTKKSFTIRLKRWSGKRQEAKRATRASYILESSQRSYCA